MKAKLAVSRPGYKNEAVEPRIIPTGEEVKVTGNNELGRMTAITKEGYVLNFSQDEAEVL